MDLWAPSNLARSSHPDAVHSELSCAPLWLFYFASCVRVLSEVHEPLLNHVDGKPHSGTSPSYDNNPSPHFVSKVPWTVSAGGTWCWEDSPRKCGDLQRGRGLHRVCFLSSIRSCLLARSQILVLL